MSRRMIAAAGAEVWVAIDLSTIRDVIQVMSELNRTNRSFGVKLGLEAIVGIGLEDLFNWTRVASRFVDGKFCDIPNTVAGAARSLQRFKPMIFNVHANGGVCMMEAAVKERGRSNVFAVTVLTSMDDAKDEPLHSYGCDSKLGVARFAAMAAKAGVQGLICSPADLGILNGLGVDDLLRLCPGIRPSWASAKGDQSRVTTPAEAAVAGADGIVVGRPVLSPPIGMTRTRALQMVHDEFRLMTALRELGGILRGHYVYKSGRHGPLYFNKDVLWGTLDADQAAQAIVDSLPKNYHYDAVVGPETGGAKLAKIIGGMMGQECQRAYKTDYGFAFDSWDSKWKEVLIVEDVLTTGGSLDKVISAVQDRGGSVTVKRALLNRGGVQMPGLETIATLGAVSYAAEDCPLCKSGVPISTDAGHAKPKL